MSGFWFRLAVMSIGIGLVCSGLRLDWSVSLGFSSICWALLDALHCVADSKTQVRTFIDTKELLAEVRRVERLAGISKK